MERVTFDYNEVAYRLSEEAAIVIFRKKDESIRVMLCTSSMRVLDNVVENAGYVEMQLASRSNRCNGTNKNVCVVDLVIDEPRQFNTDRTICIYWMGRPKTKEELDSLIEAAQAEKEKWRDFGSWSEAQQMMFIHSLGDISGVRGE